MNEFATSPQENTVAEESHSEEGAHEAEAIPSVAASAPPEEPTDGNDRSLEAHFSDPALSADPGAAAHPDSDAAPALNPEILIDELRNELTRLREEITAREAFRARLEQEYDDFAALYPEVALTSLSDAVWTSVQNGTPLAAAYALEERRQMLLNRCAEQSNAENHAKSAGGIQNAPNTHYTVSEVRAMSRAEVRENMTQIMESMKKWR